MTATLTERNTLMYEVDHIDWLPLAANTKILAGWQVAINAAGYAVPASSDATLTIAGRAEISVDNTNGAAGQGKKLTIRRGIFRWLNSTAGDAITLADRYKDVYAVDNQTVAKTSNSNARPRSGKVVNVDPQGVWVNNNPLMGT